MLDRRDDGGLAAAICSFADLKGSVSVIRLMSTYLHNVIIGIPSCNARCADPCLAFSNCRLPKSIATGRRRFERLCDLIGVGTPACHRREAVSSIAKMQVLNTGKCTTARPHQ
jgi:hypothetical protein